ncbi:hypothetical protein ACIS_00868 [Anaplasma centrale str. Israel]|uniref:Uncharacterized protein n=1 Tax=Anaplasma centrale (strain Israel) TaxID=574556 RepID=D1ASE2_ANACI|nr:hypothetical protein [Anaplasma centrale]ACZ49395.1 hypothetical protein ACIS_00868 [Anaplasma centrale str. Israel]
MRALMDAEGVFAACTTVNSKVDKAVEQAISDELEKLVRERDHSISSMQYLNELARSEAGQAAIGTAQNKFLKNVIEPTIESAFGNTKAAALRTYIDSKLPQDDNEARFNLALAMHKLAQLKTPTDYVRSLDDEDFQKLVAFVDVASNIANTLSEDELQEVQRKREALYSGQKASFTESMAERMKQAVGGEGDIGAMAKSALKFVQNMIQTKKPPRSSDVVCTELLSKGASAAMLVCALCVVGSGGMAAALFPIQAALAVVGAMRTITADEKDTAGIHNPLGGFTTPRMFSEAEPRQDLKDRKADETFALREERKKSAVEVNTDLRNRSS